MSFSKSFWLKFWRYSRLCYSYLSIRESPVSKFQDSWQLKILSNLSLFKLDSKVALTGLYFNIHQQSDKMEWLLPKPFHYFQRICQPNYFSEGPSSFHLMEFEFAAVNCKKYKKLMIVSARCLIVCCLIDMYNRMITLRNTRILK